MTAKPSSDPYWWREAPLTHLPEISVDATCDVVIVGAGYTGLSAAITLARAGRSVQVFDRQRPGEGASSRNGGITSGNVRLGHGALARRFGEPRATAIETEGKEAREDLYRFIAEEKIDCDFARVGRFMGAAGAGDYDRLAREADRQRRVLGVEAHAVPRAEQRHHIGTERYFGGALRMDIGGLHPAKLHASMLRLAQSAGARIHGETAVLGISQETGGYAVSTARGRVRAGAVITGTNGYTDAADRWLRRRLVPVRSRIIATEPLSPNLMGALMPSRLMYGDTRRLHYYYRPSPDGTRILFGGRDGTIVGDPQWPTASLRKTLVGLFPELGDTRIEHSWFGHVAFSRDMIPRVFSRHGVRYAVGYCGSGVVWARWAGKKAALQLLGEQAGRSALDFRPPRAVPMFNGTAWFMPAVFAWLSARDRISAPRD